MKSIRASALLLAAAMTIAAKDEAPIDPGPQPNPEVFKQKAEAALLAGFFDPSSAQIQWDRDVVGGYFKPPFSKKRAGWWTCGLINGKNRMGGYVGFRRFIVVMNSGEVTYSSVSDGGNFDIVGTQCAQAISKGILPAAGTNAPQQAVIDRSKPRFGFNIDAVPDGAYLKNVEDGSPAAKAGVTNGMVVSRINGVPIKGFDAPTIGKLVLAIDGEATLTIIGKGDVKISRAVFP